VHLLLKRRVPLDIYWHLFDIHPKDIKSTVPVSGFSIKATKDHLMSSTWSIKSLCHTHIHVQGTYVEVSLHRHKCVVFITLSDTHHVENTTRHAWPNTYILLFSDKYKTNTVRRRCRLPSAHDLATVATKAGACSAEHTKINMWCHNVSYDVKHKTHCHFSVGWICLFKGKSSIKLQLICTYVSLPGPHWVFLTTWSMSM